MRETEAESVAFVVCSAIGLETGTAAQDYVGLNGGDLKLLLQSLQYIQQAANRILAAIAPDNSATTVLQPLDTPRLQSPFSSSPAKAPHQSRTTCNVNLGRPTTCDYLMPALRRSVL